MPAMKPLKGERESRGNEVIGKWEVDMSLDH